MRGSPSNARGLVHRPRPRRIVRPASTALGRRNSELFQGRLRRSVAGDRVTTARPEASSSKLADGSTPKARGEADQEVQHPNTCPTLNSEPKRFPDRPYRSDALDRHRFKNFVNDVHARARHILHRLLNGFASRGKNAPPAPGYDTSEDTGDRDIRHLYRAYGAVAA